MVFGTRARVPNVPSPKNQTVSFVLLGSANLAALLCEASLGNCQPHWSERRSPFFFFFFFIGRDAAVLSFGSH